MENNLFLKKFKNSCELLGKEGPVGILNHLHNSIKGYKPKKIIKKITKIKQQKNPEYDYSYVSSIVKADFNKNINFMPQLSVLLNPMKFQNDEIYNNIVKRQEINKLEEKKLITAKNSDNNDNSVVKNKKPKTNGIKLNYIKTNKNTKTKFEDKNELNYYNSRKKRLILNNKLNFNNNSKEILPLISNGPQDYKPPQNTNKKKSFTPIIGGLYNIVKKNISPLINFENSKIIKRSNSTMNISSQNIDGLFFNKKRNKQKPIGNFANRSINFRPKNYDKIRNEIAQNQKPISNQIELSESERKMRKRKKMVKDWLKYINDSNPLKNYIYQNNDENNFNYQKDNDYNLDKNTNNRLSFYNNSNIEEVEEQNQFDDDNLCVINEEESESYKNNKMNNIEDNQEPNLMEVLMKQRQQYFKNIQNQMRLKKYMEN